MKRCVIVGGAEIGNPDWIRSLLRAQDFFVFCDGGLRHTRTLDVEPDLIVGDFDSHPRPETAVETIVLPREKDDTDTAYAVKEALRRGFREFLLLGAVGERLDHSLVNVSLLLLLRERGGHGVLADDYSLMELVPGAGAEIGEEYAYFSLLCLGGAARGVTIENAKFPLLDAEIRPDYQYGCSNEVLPGKRARVTLREGTLLLIRVR